MRRFLGGLISVAALSSPAFADTVSGPDFAAGLAGFDGKTVTITRCDIFKQVNDQGMMSCTAKTGTGEDALDARGLPVYVFFKVDGLSAATKALIDSCDMFCPGAITGKASVAPGTLFVEFTDVSFAKIMP